MDTFKIVFGIVSSFFAACLGEFYLRFRPNLPKEFVLKSDCQRISGQIHKENREDHQIIFAKLDKLKDEMAKTQNLIMRELAKRDG